MFTDARFVRMPLAAILARLGRGVLARFSVCYLLGRNCPRVDIACPRIRSRFAVGAATRASFVLRAVAPGLARVSRGVARTAWSTLRFCSRTHRPLPSSAPSWVLSGMDFLAASAPPLRERDVRFLAPR